MRWSVSFYLSSKRNRKFKHLVQTKPMGENIITNIMKLSVASTSLKESAKKSSRVIKCKTNNSQQAEESKDCNFGIYRQCHRPQRYKFRQRLRWSRRRRATVSLLQYPNEIMKTSALRKSKYYINTGSFRHHNNVGSAHPSMATSKEKKLPPPFSGFKSQKSLHVPNNSVLKFNISHSW